MTRGSKGGFRRHFSYSNVVATVALFLAIGGGVAFAAALKKNSVKSKQIAANAVKTSEIADSAVTTSKLADAAATGAKVDEGSLGKVPSATAADTVGGKTADDLLTSSAFDANSTVIADMGAGGHIAVATATITTNSTGRIIATGSAELMGPAASVGDCFIRVDGNDSPAYESEPDDLGPSSQFVIAVNHAVTRPPGTYVASLLCGGGAGGGVGKDDAAIAVYGLGL